MPQKQCLEEVHCDTGLPQKRGKTGNQQLNLPPKIIRKRRTNSRMKEIMKIREEVNKIEIQKTIEENQ